MEIKASTVYDLKAARALIHLHLFKGANPKKCMITFFILLPILLILSIKVMETSEYFFLFQNKCFQ